MTITTAIGVIVVAICVLLAAWIGLGLALLHGSITPMMRRRAERDARRAERRKAKTEVSHHGVDIGGAMNLLRAGFMVRRLSWHCSIRLLDGKIVWSPEAPLDPSLSVEDLLAKDWVLT